MPCTMTRDEDPAEKLLLLSFFVFVLQHVVALRSVNT